MDQNVQEFISLSPVPVFDAFFWCSVEGNPMGAEGIEITIDGITVASGFDGLALVEGLTVGDHDYSASFDGYITQTGTISIIDQNVQEFITMIPAPMFDAFFWCSVEGNPMGTEGIDITIDGVTVSSGFDGLALVEGLTVGDHDYSASFDGYITQTGTISIIDQNVQEFITMIPAPMFDAFFWCSVEGNPMGTEGIEITIDGVTVTSAFDGLALFEGLSIGDHDYSASFDGYETQTGTISIVDQNVEQFIIMIPVPTNFDAFFWCSVEGNPMGAEGIEITIDGVTVTSAFDG
ncbi:hypothetical protein HNS38_20080, partial [Lentimicrobium sp. L6]|uniref:hypothetical protein n=1 Tax=Lentimicrobium sp. L6 TaxID=2735916 RepID=UPI001554BBE9